MIRNACKTLKIHQRLLSQARPYWLHLTSFFLLSLLATPLALLAPVPLKVAVDNVLGNEPVPVVLDAMLPDGWGGSTAILLALVAVMVILFALLTLVQQLIHAMLQTYTGEKMVMAFRERLFRHVQRLSLSYHDTKGTADSTYRIQYDAPSIQTVIIGSLIPLISAVFMLVCMIFIIAQISLRLAGVALVVVPILLLITVFFSGRLRQRWRDVKKLESSAQSVIQEVLGAVRVVKAFSRENQEQGRFADHSHLGVNARVQAAFQENCYTLLAGTTIAGGTAAVLYLGAIDVQRGALTLGQLLLAMAYLKNLFDPLKTIGKQIASKQRALASAERAFELLDELPEVAERPDARPLSRAVGHVAFDSVTFAYGDGPPVLQHVNLQVSAGSRVGILGRTGAGKTTLVNLLTRFYDPVAGRIELDGVDLRDYRLADLREQFAIVLQEPVLFSTSIAENIAYGRSDATEAEVVAAARAADADDFIRAMPEGYDTLVGERGMRLSGGERQRISLARAFLRDAPILIMDEPTSSVDTQTEHSIMQAMHRLMAGRTTFMIAHRLSTLDECDRLLKVEDGQLIDVTDQDAEGREMVVSHVQ